MNIFGKKNEEKAIVIEKNEIEKTDKPQLALNVFSKAILSPHLTEKARLLGKVNKYVFKIDKNSNKIQIQKAIEKMYKVKVKKVAVISIPSKTRRVGRYEGKKSGFKKAIVTLFEGNKIDIIG